MATVPESDSSYAALHVAQLLDKLGLGRVGQLVVQGPAQGLLAAVFVADLSQRRETKCGRRARALWTHLHPCLGGTWLCSWDASLAC